MRFQDALEAVREALRVTGLTPTGGNFVIYLNFTTKALSLHQRSIAYPPLGQGNYIKAKPDALKQDGTPRNDFWIVGFTSFPEAFTVFITLAEILRCRYFERFAISVDRSAKPSPFFPF